MYGGMYMDKFNLDGMWWLPGRESETVSGSLVYNPRESIYLSLNGSFKDIEQVNNINNHNIILGVTSKGKHITLYKCYETKSSFSMPGYPTTIYQIQYIFEGEHFETPESLSFERYLISFSNLENWTGVTGFQKHIVKDNNYAMVLTYNHPEERYITEIDDVKIEFDYVLNSKVNIISSYELTQTTYIKLTKKDGKISFEHFMSNYLYNLQNFLTLTTGVTTFPLIIQCGNRESDITYGSEDEKIKENNLNIFYSIQDYPENIKYVQTHNMPLPYNSIKPDLETMLQNWFLKADTLQPIYQLYFGTLYNSTMYLQHRFLSIAQAIESYHRRIHGGLYLEEEKYQSLKRKLEDVMKEELEGELRNIFIQKLSYMNEISLRSRLKELIEINKEFIDPVFKSDKHFINDVLNTRNYLTHYDKSLEERAKKGVDLYKIVEKLKFILEICFMQEIGVSQEKIMENIEWNFKYNYLKSL